MKNKKVFLMLLSSVAMTSCFLTSCNQTTGNSSSSFNSIIRDPDEVYVTEVKVTTPPNKTNYVPGEESFDSTGMVLQATWSDGYVEENVSSTKYYVEPAGIIPAGTDHVTIYYGDASVVLPIQTNATMTLRIKQVPVKTDYTVGEVFDPKGLILEYEVNGQAKEIDDYDVNKVTFVSKPLTKQDKFVEVTYNKLSVNVPINVRGQNKKVELEDNLSVNYTSGTSPTGSEIMPGSKLKITRNNEGKYLVNNDSKTLYETYEEAYNAAYQKATAATKTQVAQASAGDFLAFLDGTGATFTVNLKDVESEEMELYIRGASNWAFNIQNWTPYQIGDMVLNEFMTIKVNGREISLADNLILPGCGDGTKGDHAYWTNWTTLDLGKITLNPSLETNTIEFSVNIEKGLDENNEYKYLYNNSGQYAFGQYDYILLEDLA